MSVVLSEHLPLLASAPDGIAKLRNLILGLAISGKLVAQDPGDQIAKVAFDRFRIPRKKPAEPLLKKFPIPSSWLWCEVGDLNVLRTGATPSTLKTENFGGEIRWLVSGDIHKRDITDCDGRITEQGLASSNCKILPENSVLIALNGQGKTRATVAILRVQAACNQSLVAMTPVSEEVLLSEFLYLNLRFRYYEIRDITGQKQRRGLNMGLVADLSISLPPVAEQQRIVAKVDELMALCDRLEAEQADAASAHARLAETLLGTLTQSTDAADLAANWQRLAEHFDTLFTTEASIDALRQTVLQLAVMGKLVPQVAEDEPASELLKQIAQERARLEAKGLCKKPKEMPPVGANEQPFELPQGWEWSRLGVVSRNVQYGYTASADHTSKDVLFLRITDIQDNRVDWNSVPGCRIPAADVPSYQLQRGDIVIARTGGTIGKSYLVDGLDQTAIFASYLIRVGYLNGTNSTYTKVFLGSECYWAQLYANSMGTGQPNVNGTALSSLKFPLPPLAEQHRIVAKVDELMVLCEQLKADLAAARERQASLADALIESALEAA